MVKLYYLGVLYKDGSRAKILRDASDLTSFGFFQRSSVSEFLKFSSRILVERTLLATRSSVKEKEYMCHCYVRSDGLSGIVISDHEYPQRVAHTLLNNILQEFAGKIGSEQWSRIPEGGADFKGLEIHLAKYQNPTQADAMSKIQQDLDETKVIMHNTIEAVLNRGEKLDDLVAKSEHLSMQSKTFYTTARKTNQCCVLL